MTLAIRLDLQPLYRRPLLRTRRPVHAHDALCRAIAGHDLRWGRGVVDTRLFLQPLGQLTIMSLAYGAEVEIQAEPFKGFSLIQMPLRGVTEFYADGMHIITRPGDVALLTPRKSERVLWKAGCEQVLVKVPHSLVNCVALDEGHDVSTSFWQRYLLPAQKFPPALMPVWQALLQQWLVACEAQARGRLTSGWLRHLEVSAGVFLAQHAGDASLSAEAQADDCLGRGAADRRWRRLKDAMMSCLAEPVSQEELAAAVGLSTSALTRLCRRRLGMTPMVALRHMRLDAARQWLLRHPGRSVTEAALNHGFSHLGRFSAYYHERFGEMPRETASQRSCRRLVA